MEDGDMESYPVSMVIQDAAFLCPEMGSISGYFL